MGYISFFNPATTKFDECCNALNKKQVSLRDKM